MYLIIVKNQILIFLPMRYNPICLYITCWLKLKPLLKYFYDYSKCNEKNLISIFLQKMFILNISLESVSQRTLADLNEFNERNCFTYIDIPQTMHVTNYPNMQHWYLNALSTALYQQLWNIFIVMLYVMRIFVLSLTDRHTETMDCSVALLTVSPVGTVHSQCYDIVEQKNVRDWWGEVILIYRRIL